MNWRIGSVKIFQIVEMEGGDLIQESLPDATPQKIKKIKWLFPKFADKNGRLKALVQSFLIQSNGKNILIDTCNGNGKTRPTCPTWGTLNTNFLEKLKPLGLSKNDIDFVVNTHLHFDHVGWNTQKKNEKWVPTFPNAKYFFVETEYHYWKTKPDKEAKDDILSFEDSVDPIVKAGLAKLVKSDFRIDENIKLVPTPGHTPGHISIMIESSSNKALISADFMHHPCQFEHPEWTMPADAMPETALKTRKKMFKMLANSNILFIGTHFANPVAGKLTSSNDEIMFRFSK
jgi:glyoxylase-like metal-dependent hydrolase (beta-lactamase superfamily II)